MDSSEDVVSVDKYTHLQNMFLKGDDIQKLSIIQALPQLLRIDQHATFSRIVPKIQQELPKASSEFQVTTSQIFRVLIEKELPINLLGAVIQGVDSRDPVVSAAWMDTLLSVIPLLSENTIKNEIMPLIVIKSQLSQPVIQRVAGCRIIGKIANHKALKPSDIRNDVLPFVHSLSQDCSVEVRAVICMQLPFVAEGMGIATVKTQLLPCFVELASDNNSLVKEAAILTLVNLFPYIEKELVETTIIPLVKKLCEKCMPEDNIGAIIASQYGAILENVMSCMSHDDKSWFLTFYKILARTGFETRPGGLQNVDASKDVVCRENCAANLPAVAKFVSVVAPHQMDVLYSIFRDLAGDPCYIVRRAVAGCIHEIAKILGPQNRMLKADFVRLLRDDAEDVLQMLVPNLKSTLTLLAQFGFLSKDRTDQTTMEISRAVLKCQIELAKGYNWRLLATFIEQLECLPQCMSCDFIHQHFTPIILGNATNGRAKPIRYQATRTLLVFLRGNKKDNQQKWLRDALINQFCYSDSCYTRQIYVKLCFYALDIFSSKYFKEHFFQPLLNLSEDPVSNVRYTFISILPGLKLLTLLPPIDSKFKVILQDAITKLETKEKEKYIVQHLRTILKEVQSVSLVGNKDLHARDLIKQEQETAFNSSLPEKQIATITGHQGMKPKIPPAPGPPNRPGRRSSLVKTPTVASKTVTPSSTTDMNFLEQHFYTDAGINLPDAIGTVEQTKNSESNGPIDATTTSIHHHHHHHHHTEETVLVDDNMTDDLKANLSKKSNRLLLQHVSEAVSFRTNNNNNNNSDTITYISNITTKAKRHSSATLSEHRFNGKIKNHHKRHSIHVSTAGRESSRIPVCVKQQRGEMSLVVAGGSKRESLDVCNKICALAIKANASELIVGNFNGGRPSSLPIAVRKPSK